ncbi:hypothetical protein DM02DRAFT_652662 [Periconia macrospinosa]|uniref:Uncharacterized protein n=1 Tax=Periconia macrospinosa TaxID=97972 RepID=A0A2V1DZF4_9PLEO|nr:hypothetical protein DM02DRAFT_652662 [Periconia macrospinosa]
MVSNKRAKNDSDAIFPTFNQFSGITIPITAGQLQPSDNHDNQLGETETFHIHKSLICDDSEFFKAAVGIGALVAIGTPKHTIC